MFILQAVAPVDENTLVRSPAWMCSVSSMNSPLLLLHMVMTMQIPVIAVYDLMSLWVYLAVVALHMGPSHGPTQVCASQPPSQCPHPLMRPHHPVCALICARTHTCPPSCTPSVFSHARHLAHPQHSHMRTRTSVPTLPPTLMAPHAHECMYTHRQQLECLHVRVPSLACPHP